MRAMLRLGAVLVIAAIAVPVSANTIVVDWSGGSIQTIQAGLDSASPGDTVLVMSGIYTGAGNHDLDFGGTDCVLKSSGGATSVTIDCAGSGRAIAFLSGETSACVVEGLTITNGAQVYGAGIYFASSSPTIRDCVFLENIATNEGGGVICESSSDPTFVDCAFSGNRANWGGGGAFGWTVNPSFENCTFTDNTAVSGGGGAFLDRAYPSFAGCTFSGNSASGAYTTGGGIYMQDAANPVFRDCLFSDNTAPGVGGAVEIVGGSIPSFARCTFTGNHTDSGGGAVDMYDTVTASFDSCCFYDNTTAYEGGAVYSSGGSVPTFTGCTIARNTSGLTGGAMYFYDFSTPVLTGCTLYANSAPTGSGIWCDDNFTLTNSIIAFGVGGEAVYCDGDAPYPDCSDIYGNAGGDWVGCLAGLDVVDSNFSENPLFCDAPNGEFTLDVASPCAGPNAPGCGLVGAWDIGCDTPVRVEGWGAIKAMYR